MYSHSSKTGSDGQVAHVPVAALKGRGTAWAIEHRFTSASREPFDDGWGSAQQVESAQDVPSAPGTQIIEQSVRSILTGNDSPDISFDLSINPYRGCEHGCIYCFARPTHSYLNLSPGIDFETRIIAKVNAVERLRAALDAPGYVPSMVNIGSATDAYQPAERRLRITRGLIDVMWEYRHPFSLITKSSGIERDLDLLSKLAAERLVAVYVSVTTLEPSLARVMEPRASAPERRLRTMERLARAGVPVGVSVSPLIPFLNDGELERILLRAHGAGASSAFATPLRLPWEVNPLFQQWLQTHFPERAARVMARVRELRGGKDNDPCFGTRMTGQGVWADLIRQRLSRATAKLGMNRERVALDVSQFRPKRDVASCGQGSLF